MISVVFHPDAEAELISAAIFYEGKQKDLGRRFLSAIGDGISRININPSLFPRIDGNVRRCLTRNFPFGVLFRHRNEQIEIIAVMHLKREPEYWRDRL